jgi:hypothetical protein
MQEPNLHHPGWSDEESQLHNEDPMPEKKTIERTRRDKLKGKAGKTPSTD